MELNKISRRSYNWEISTGTSIEHEHVSNTDIEQEYVSNRATGSN